MLQPWALGVFTSVDAGLGAGLDAVRELGVPSVQVHAPSPERRRQAKEIRAAFDQAGVEITVCFCGFAGESYADIPTVQRTIGLVPREQRPERLAETKAIADFAAEIGVKAIGMHIGFVPEDHSNPLFGEVVAVAQEVCDYIKQYDQRFHLETGQETGPGLKQFIETVDRPNLAINFDPANMIMYGSGEPLPALKLVGQWVRSVHCKDAKWSAKPGAEWGPEVAWGSGDVNAEAFLRTLKEIGYTGPLTIEREISGPDQIRDIRGAVELLERHRAEILG